MPDHQIQHWQLNVAGFSIEIACPAYFAALLSETLTGWTLAESIDTQPPKILVQRIGDAFSVDALVMGSPLVDKSIVNVLNEFFVVLAYQWCNAEVTAHLLHCAGFRQNGENFVVVGEKNSGKSTRVLHAALDGLEILADDLLLWYPSSGRFKTLGLPLRLRRPVHSKEGNGISNEMFFASDDIAYSKTGHFNIAPGGREFLLDKLLTLAPDHSCKNVPLLQTATKLHHHVIGEEYTSLKKLNIG